MADLEIYDRISTGGTTWVQVTGVPDRPRVMVLSASGDFQIGYSAVEPVNDFMHVESNAKMPFVLFVENPSNLWFKTPAGSNLINMMGYPPNVGHIPYA